MKKILIITESQYKRLVRSKKIVSEQVVYKDPKDEKDIHSKMFRILGSVGYGLKTLFNKPLYILKIEGGIVYVDKSEYQQNEIDYIKTEFEKLVRSGISSYDKMLTGSDDLGFDSGQDADYVWPDVPEPIDVPDVPEPIDVPEETECECINADTNQKYVYNCDDSPPIECFVTDDPAEVEDVDIDYDINKTYTRSEYINLVKNIAINQMNKYKIPASITIGQAIIESGNGNSKLAKEGKNHFGIKCHGWTGDKSYHDDDRPNECFRNYDKIGDSFEDHSIFLKNNSRYNKLFDLDITDYKGWAKGLKDAAYATSSTYAETLINIIEENNLQQYDKGDSYVPDCENCVNNLTQQQKNNINSNINDNNVNDFRWWANQDSDRLKQVTDKFEECCETKDDPTLNIDGSNNEWVQIAFSVVGQEWVNSGKPKRTFEILDIDETNLIKPSSNYGNSRDYGWRDPIPSLCNEGKTRYCRKHWHGGEDYPYPNGTEIYVFQTGEVIEKGNYTLKIKHDDGSKTRYVHCDEFFVEKGDRIESGTLIGTVGNKGPSTSPHLHFEYWKPNKNKKSNPKDIEDNYIRFKL